MQVRDHGDLPGPARWELLTQVPGKAACFAGDLYFREGWATLLEELGEEGAYRFAQSTATAWLRPDAFRSGAASRLLDAIAAAGFEAAAGRPVTVDRHGIRALWAYELGGATAERLMLLDGVVSLGPGLFILYRGPAAPIPAAARLTDLKGPNVPEGRPASSLRTVAGSPNRLLTMIHTGSDPADVVRELAVFAEHADRVALIRAAVSGEPWHPVPLPQHQPQPSPAVPRPLASREAERAALREALASPDPAHRWAAITEYAARVPLQPRKPRS
ncbi:nucleoside-diphosphate kinase [Longispora albida]|uniref:nucleoside-diphosphate kinase n=1 Tax=Longispora albida TaxID=203523 RepID=UPI00037E3921|nr:nucleoside-diphosphate kinase [Longispora albida]